MIRSGRAAGVLVLALTWVVRPFGPVPWALLPVSAAAQTAQAGEPDPAIRDTLQRYAAAFESLDPNAVKKVQPSIAAETLTKAFKEMRELKVVIDEVRVLST